VIIVQTYLHRLTNAWQVKHKKSEIGLIMMDNKDAMFVSILKKLYGAYEALPYFSESCEICSETLTPEDIGVDPYTNTRTWMTKCCGEVQTYQQKLEPKL
jgi:hypothetical protein